MNDGTNPYESPRLLSEYLLFHYGRPEDVMPWPFGPREALDFAVRCVSDTFTPHNHGSGVIARALDVGCAVGRSTLELSRSCAEVLGVDFSAAFVRAAETVATKGVLDYLSCVEGAISEPLQAVRPSGVNPERVRFEVGDAMALREDLGSFQRVLAANLIDRLADPRRFLERTGDLVAPDGELVLTSPCTWLEEFTPRRNWPGGADPSTARTTLEALRDALDPWFALVKTVDLPFLIREHARKFQWSVAQTSVWRRRR